MNLSILQENLKQGILTVLHATGKNLNLPILSNLLIKAEDQITLTATNLEIGITKIIRGKINTKGSFTVDGKIISDYISLLPNQKINIEQTDNSLVIETEGYKTKIIGEVSDEYPILPVVEKSHSCSINIDEFKKALSQTIFAVSSSEIRQELSGVLFSFNDKELTLVSTDSFRLAEKKIKIKCDDGFLMEENKKIIIPSKTLQELIRILSLVTVDKIEEGEENVVKLYLGENQILFTVGDTELVSRVIEGQYPDYTQIIPSNFKTFVNVSKSELVRAIKTSAIFSKTGVNDVNLDFPRDKNKIIVSSSSGQLGENVTEIDTKVQGDDNAIVINYKSLLEGLQVIEGDDIKIEIVENKVPCVVRSSKDDGYLYIVMPIRQ